MLPKKRRITKLAFKEVLARSAYGAFPFFSVRWSKSLKNEQGEKTEDEKNSERSTFAVVISKKVMAKASDRNKIKRRCYHILRDLAPTIKNSYKIVFFVKKGIKKLSFKELSENIHTTLSKNHLIR